MNNSKKKIKVFLVDDHNLFLNGLKMILGSMSGFEVVGEASNGIEFLNKYNTANPDVVLLDISMPEMDGIEASRIALSESPNLKIITLSMYADQEYYSKMLENGVRGFLLKDSDISEVKIAIQTVVEGGNYFSQELLRNIIFAKKELSQNLLGEEDLSERELEVLMEICHGLQNVEIADKLCISKRTVEKHRSNLLLKTNSKNVAELVIYAIKNHLIEI